MTERQRDRAGTPAYIFDVLNREFGFELDVCADKTNAKCKRFLSIKEDGLKAKWDANVCWLNPPYSNIPAWLARAKAETLRGTTTVALVCLDTSTQWWVDYALTASEIRFIVGQRVQFIPPPGVKYSTNTHCSVLLIFRPRCGYSVKLGVPEVAAVTWWIPPKQKRNKK